MYSYNSHEEGPCALRSVGFRVFIVVFVSELRKSNTEETDQPFNRLHGNSNGTGKKHTPFGLLPAPQN